jgi:hypothetical protein
MEKQLPQEPFFKNSYISYLIAKLALYVQGIFTTIIITCLVLITNKIEAHEVLYAILIHDTVFVLFHLTYRALYKGTKIPLKKQTRYLLISHSILSLFALILTPFFFYFALTTTLSLLFLIILWGVSLLLGILFYKEKYRKPLH